MSPGRICLPGDFSFLREGKEFCSQNSTFTIQPHICADFWAEFTSGFEKSGISHFLSATSQTKNPLFRKVYFSEQGVFLFLSSLHSLPDRLHYHFSVTSPQTQHLFPIFFYFQALPTFPLFCSEMYTFLNKTGLLQTGRFVTC